MSDYQKSHRDQACVFGPVGCEGDVVGHHVRISGLCGTGMKPHDMLAVAACNRHHALCHNSEGQSSPMIPKSRQIEAMLRYWRERLTQIHGEAKALEMMGLAFWEAIDV